MIEEHLSKEEIAEAQEMTKKINLLVELHKFSFKIEIKPVTDVVGRLLNFQLQFDKKDDQEQFLKVVRNEGAEMYRVDSDTLVTFPLNSINTYIDHELKIRLTKYSNDRIGLEAAIGSYSQLEEELTKVRAQFAIVLTENKEIDKLQNAANKELTVVKKKNDPLATTEPTSQNSNDLLSIDYKPQFDTIASLEKELKSHSEAFKNQRTSIGVAEKALKIRCFEKAINDLKLIQTKINSEIGSIEQAINRVGQCVKKAEDALKIKKEKLEQTIRDIDNEESIFERNLLNTPLPQLVVTNSKKPSSNANNKEPLAIAGSGSDKDNEESIDESSAIIIYNKLVKLTNNYLNYLETFEYDSVVNKHAVVTALSNCLANPKVVSKTQCVKDFYTQLNDSVLEAIKEHRNPSWKRYIKAALIIGGIFLSGILPGLAVLAAYMTSSKKNLGSLRFWKSEGEQFVEKVEEHKDDGNEFEKPMRRSTSD